MKKIIIKSIIMVVVLCCVIFVAKRFFIGSWTSDNINRYIKVTESKSALPKIEDFGEYSDIEFKYYRKNMIMFFSDAYILKVSYDDENYQKEKDNFLQNFIYETETLKDYGGYYKEPSFVMDTYSF